MHTYTHYYTQTGTADLQVQGQVQKQWLALDQMSLGLGFRLYIQKYT